MKKFIISSFLFFAFILYIFPAFEFMPGNVKVKSMQYTTTALIMGMDNTIINPASLIGVDYIETNVSYENLYWFVHTFSASIGYNTGYGVIGGKYAELFVIGDNTDTDTVLATNARLHTERSFQLTYATKLADVLSFGSNVNFLYLSQLNSSSNFYYTFDFGLIGQVYERWNIGLSVRNASNSYIIGGIDQYKYYFDRTVSAGLSFEPYDNLTTSFDVSKSTGWPTSFGGGIEYEMYEGLFTIRAGARSYPIEYGAGFEIEFEKFSIDYGFTANQYISDRHHIQLNYSF